MKVLVTAIAQPSGISGVQRHALNLVRCLLLRTEITSVHLALAPWQVELPALAGLAPDHRLRLEFANVRRNSASRNLWHLYRLPDLVREIKADIVQLTYPVPFRRKAIPCPIGMTLHDLYPFEIPRNFGFPQVVVNRVILRSALLQADSVCCVSKTTWNALRISGLCRSATTTVIPNCVEPASLISHSGPLPNWNGEAFLLAVAQHRRNKNLDLLVRSFGALVTSGVLERCARLAVVGMQGPETRKLHTLAHDLGIRHRVDFLSDLSDPQLQWCYKHCAALVAPSSTEGFGLPVVEARLAGCRVVCSDIPAFRELAGPHTQWVDLRGDADHALQDAIAEALSRPRPLPEHLPQFAMESVANSYAEVFQTMLSQTTSSVLDPETTSPLERRQVV